MSPLLVDLKRRWPDAVLILLIVLAVLLAMCAVSSDAEAATYHVRQDGSDTKCSGLTNAAETGTGPLPRACALLTLAKGATTAIVPDDVLEIHAGTYFESPSFQASGTSGHPITIRGAVGETVTIDSGVNYARAPGNADWTLIDAGKGIWESTFNLPGTQTYVYGYLTTVPNYEFGIPGLVPYNDTRYVTGGKCTDPAGARFGLRCTAPGSGCSVCETGIRGQTGVSMFASGTEEYAPDLPFYIGPGTVIPAECTGGDHPGTSCSVQAGSRFRCDGGSAPLSECTVPTCSSANQACTPSAECPGGGSCVYIADEDCLGTIPGGRCAIEHCSNAPSTYCETAADCPAGGSCNAGAKVRIRLSKTRDVRDYERDYGRVLYNENDTPANYGILLSRASQTIEVKASYLTFQNLTVNPALRTIWIKSPSNCVNGSSVLESPRRACTMNAECTNASFPTCPDGTLQGLIFGGSTQALGLRIIEGDKGIAMGGSNGDFPVKNGLIDHCTFTGSDAQYIFWTDAKDTPAPADKMRSVNAIDFRKGANNWTVQYSLIRASHDGLGSGNNCEFNIYAHHNRMDNLHDDAFETEADTLAFEDAPGCRYCVGGSNANAPCPNGTGCTGGTCSIVSFIGQMDAYENMLNNTYTFNAIGQSSSTMKGVCTGGAKPGYLCDFPADCTGGGTCKADHHFYRNYAIKSREPAINRKGKPDHPEGIRTFNDGYRYGSEYGDKSHTWVTEPLDLPRIFNYHNDRVMSTSAALGFHVVPKTSFSSARPDTWTDSNLYVKVNGIAQGIIPTYTGLHLDYDAYFRYNANDGATLLDGRATVAAECSARGYECHGVGSTANVGTDPKFLTFAPAFDRTNPMRWKFAPQREVYTPKDFLRNAATSPLCSAANPSLADPRGGAHPDLPDSRPTHDDIGALECGVADEWSTTFPFNQGWAGPSPRASVLGGGQYQGVTAK